MKLKKQMAVILVFLFAVTAAAQQPVVKWHSPLNISPFPPKSGDLMTFKIKLRVSGGDARNVTVFGGVDDQQLFIKNIPMITMMDKPDLEFQWTATAGSHKAYFYIDPDRGHGNFRVAQKVKERGFSVMQGARTSVQRTKKATKPGPVTSESWKPVQPVPAERKKSSQQDDPGQFTPLMQEYDTVTPLECNEPGLPDYIITSISESGFNNRGQTIDITVRVQNIGQCDAGMVEVHLVVKEQVSTPSGTNDYTQDLGYKIIAPIPSHYGDAYNNAQATFKYAVTDRGNATYMYKCTATVESRENYQEFVVNNNEKIMDFVVNAQY